MVLADIEKDVINDSINISTILRKVKILAYKLKISEFKDWIENELNGYDIEKVVPNYRKFELDNFGHFIGMFGTTFNNAPIPNQLIKECDREYFKCNYILTESVRSIESLVEGESVSLHVPYPPDYLLILNQSNIYQHMNCVSAWRSIKKVQLESVLDTIRNRVLTLLLELQDKYPNINKSDEELGKVSTKEVTLMINNYIFGNDNILGSGTEIDIKSKKNNNK